MKKYVLLTFFLCLFMLGVSPASALVIYDGSDFNESLNDGALITDSIFDPSSFAYRDIVSQTVDGELSGTIAFSDIPLFSIGSILYFGFIFDSQETVQVAGSDNEPEITIDDIVIAVSGSTVWDLNEPITLNPTSGLISSTFTPQGAGGDLELYIPVSLFDGLGLLGSDSLTFTSTLFNTDNGHDEWIVDASGTSFFDPDDPIGSQPVPEPATMVLVGSGLLGLAGLGRKRLMN